MRIVEVVDTLNHVGGAERFVSSLSEELYRLKEDVFVVVLYDGIDEQLLKDFGKSRIFFCKKRGRFDYRSSVRLRRILNSLRPDIVHIHKTILSYFLAFGSKKKKWKLFYTAHTVPSRLNKYTKFVLRRLTKRQNISLIGISETISEMLKNMFKSNNVYRIDNGIKIPQAIGTKNNLYTFVSVARFEPVKNHLFLIEAFGELIKRKPNTTMILVGGGSTFNDSVSLVKALGLDKNVIFSGPSDCVDYYLDQSSIFVLASKWEGNPISILEAMAHGLPILAPNVGGIPDIVRNDRNGILFNPNNKTELVEAMLKLIEDKQKCEFFKINNQIDVRSFSISVCAEKYIDVFKRKD